jgi:hypothetical protein
MRFMGRSPRPFLTLSGDSAHRNAALLLKFLSELYRTGDGMLSIVGTMEERFHLLDRNGVGHLFLLHHGASCEPDQLPALLHRLVRVFYRDTANNLIGHTAVCIDLLEG